MKIAGIAFVVVGVLFGIAYVRAERDIIILRLVASALTATGAVILI